MKLVDLKRSKKELKTDSPCKEYVPDPYGYGTQINLEKEQVDKLFGDTLPKVGDVYSMEAVVSVKRVEQNSSTDRDSCTVSLQVRKVGLEKQAKSALSALSKGIDEAKDA